MHTKSENSSVGGQSVLAALSAFVKSRIDELSAEILALYRENEVKNIEPEEIKTRLKEIARATNQINELLGWVYPPRKPFDLDELGKLSDLLRDVGYPSSEAQGILEKARTREKGRPATMRQVAIAALDLKLQRKRSWTEIANRVCPCGKDKHDHACSENIRQSVLALQRLIKKYQIPNLEKGEKKSDDFSTVK